MPVQEFKMDAVTQPTNQGMQSDPVPVTPLCRYKFGGFVKRLAGSGSYNLAIEWLNLNKEHISYEHSWMGNFVGSEWDPNFIEVIAPEAAAYAKIIMEIPAGCACNVRDMELIPISPHGPKPAIDLIMDAMSQKKPQSAIIVRIENRGEPKLTGLRVEVKLPDGMNSPDALNFPADDLSFGRYFAKKLALNGFPKDLNSPITCEVTAQVNGTKRVFTQSTKPFVTTANEITAAAADLPEPHQPKMPIKLGAYYFPVMLDWDRNNWGVRKVDYLRPKLGFYDEAKPEVSDWHIYWALEHGVSYFVFDWYYNQGMTYINDALEKSFLQSRFADKMDFCIDWCNEGQCTEFKPLDFSDKSLEDMTRMLCERYFCRKNYLRVDDKPVMLIHMPQRIVNAHGGWDGCKAALNKMRAVAKSYGHPGIYFVAVQNNTPWLQDFKRGGFDCVTAYAYGVCDVEWNLNTQSLPYDRLIPKHGERFELARDNAHKQGLDYIPTAWVGWDDAARSNKSSARTAGNTPSAFRRMIEMLPDYVEPKTKLALFESWNEWGEGGQAEPEELYGFGRLSAIRDVLSNKRGPYDIFVPNEAEIRRLSTDTTYDQVNDDYYQRYAKSLGLKRGLKMDFSSNHDLWLRPGSDISNLNITKGALTCKSTSGDPILIGPPAMDMQAESVKTVKLRMRVSAGSKGQLFWITGDQRQWNESRAVTFDLIADGKYHNYTLNMSANADWKGEIYQFRFDPTDAPGNIAIDYFHAAPE